MKKIIFLLFGVLLLSNCARNYYVNPDFDKKTQEHQTLAILPFKIITTGKKPENATPEGMAKIQRAESHAFQISLYNQLLRSTKGGRKPFKVEFQSFDITNSTLQEKGITIEDTWDINPAELAKLLGVDAAVKVTIQKKRYLSNLESYGIDMGIRVLSEISGVSRYIPRGLAKTNDVKLNCDVVNSKDGATLYNLACSVSVDWSRSTTQVIESINYRIPKRFPYRE